MMADINLKGTKTEKNLKKALQGEALAHLKYRLYKSQLSKYSKEHEQIIDEIIHNEKEHGKIWFKALHDDVIQANVENLLDAYIGEKYECLEMYPSFSRIAEDEGFYDIAKLFYQVAKIEGYHMKQFEKMKADIETGKSFGGDDEVRWKCLNCGYQYDGKEALDKCPVCSHPKKHFVKI